MRTPIAAAALLTVAVSILAEVPTGPTVTVAPPSGDVTIPLQTYEGLRLTNDRPSATVVDTILLGGGFRDRNLTITFTGRSTGTRPLARALEQTSDATISSCSGNAMIVRSGKGAFDVVPLADAFETRCELRISGSDRLKTHVTAAVLAVRSNVGDAELISGDEDDSGARDYTLVRHVTGPGEVLAATATGRYLITLLPDATRFRYAIDVHNPNRTTSSLDVVLQSQEHLQQIDSAAPYEVNGNRHIFAIPPGDSTIILTGELRGTNFVAPVRASLQYLVIESHPLLRPNVQTPAKRISLGETGVTPTYRGAVAFEIGTERIGWQTTRLQALHSTGFAVSHAGHRVFVPLDGPVLGETTFAVRNEGAPELVLPPRPEPTYVSLADEAVLMTKNATGQLTVPLSQGEQNVLIQHRQPLTRGLGFAAGTIAVPQLTVPATNTHLSLAYPAQWIPLYASFGSAAEVWTPAVGQILLFLILAIWIERLLAWTGVALRTRLVIALLASFAATIVMSFLVLVVVAFGALTIAWIASQPLRKRLAYAFAFVLFGIAALIFVVLTRTTSRGYGYSDMNRSAETVVTDTAAAGAPERKVQGMGDATSPAYQGLPAKFTLPAGERSTNFSQELLRIDRPQRARIFTVSAAVVQWLGVLIAVAAMALLWLERKRIAAKFTIAAPAP
ncbi:MAG TPA: hypothetical protein VNI54_03275 [Thermoanaerobaculia bacterium]|nr:hypothetical protein [Thermoanaerobaculia bacterium]